MDKTEHNQLVGSLQAALEAEREQSRKNGERAHALEAEFSRWLRELTDSLADERAVRIKERERFRMVV